MEGEQGDEGAGVRGVRLREVLQPGGVLEVSFEFTRTRAHTHTYTRTLTHVHTHMQTRAGTHAHTCTRARARTHTYTHAHIHTNTHTCTHARTYKHVHTHAHARTRERTHPCASARVLSVSRSRAVYLTQVLLARTHTKPLSHTPLLSPLSPPPLLPLSTPPHPPPHPPSFPPSPLHLSHSHTQALRDIEATDGGTLSQELMQQLPRGDAPEGVLRSPEFFNVSNSNMLTPRKQHAMHTLTAR